MSAPRSLAIAALGSLLSLLACGEGADRPGCAESADAQLGAWLDGSCLRLRLASANATRVEAWLYRQPYDTDPMEVVALDRNDDIWSTTIPIPEELGAVFYGYRLWGPNWDYEVDWRPGTSLGLKEDVDSDGNRFNPNKLVFDPYARELSHDPPRTSTLFATGSEFRDIDSAAVATKGVALARQTRPQWSRPDGVRRDDVVYEAHVRGLTMTDSSVPAELRGTYAGAAEKASYLRDLGITAIELLPIHETENDANDEVASADGDNYWGYASLSFFAPDRRYAADKSPGGPTREFRAMVDAFHREDIKVYLDVVYNHTAETPPWDDDGRVATLYSWRGVDSSTYYELDASGRGFRNDNGVGPNVNVANSRTADMIVDSLTYWHEEMGVDGFRFDLATILGNSCDRVCFEFESDTLLARMRESVPGADLIAEPWSISDYRLGHFGSGWAEWNDQFRDTVRRHLNRLGVEEVAPRALARRISGSPDHFADDGRRPWHSLNFVVAHDGFTLADLFRCDVKNNDQPWPFGPSPGGSDYNLSSAHGGDEMVQRGVTRTALALLMLSAGVPMFNAGDEFLRSQACNNNPYNIDAESMWLGWDRITEDAERFRTFARELIAFRRAHASFRPDAFWSEEDGDANGRGQVTWLTSGGVPASDAYLDDTGERFVAYLLDGSELGDSAAAIYVGYNGGDGVTAATLPAPPMGSTWQLVVDTSPAREGSGNVLPTPLPILGELAIAPRSLVALVAN